jgi:hypothetical protein
VTDAQGWTLLALVGVLLSVIGGLIVHQFQLLRGYLDARFDAVDAHFDAVDARFGAADTRFDAVNQRLDALDRDVQALTDAVFRRE